MNLDWSKQSQNDLIEIEDYIIKFWGFSVLEDFYKELEICLETIFSKLVVHQKYEGTECFKVLLKKHYYIIYTIDNQSVHIIHLMNNHKNPEDNYLKATGKSK